MKHALNNFQIFKSLKNDDYSKHVFKAVLPRDKLPIRVDYPSSYVINTHTSEQPGEHWLAVYFDENGSCTFFDSFGYDPKYYKLEAFLTRTSREWVHNTTKLQSFNSMACGYYCIYFILLKCRGFTLTDILNLFDKGDFIGNDSRVFNVYP